MDSSLRDFRELPKVLRGKLNKRVWSVKIYLDIYLRLPTILCQRHHSRTYIINRTAPMQICNDEEIAVRKSNCEVGNLSGQ